MWRKAKFCDSLVGRMEESNKKYNTVGAGWESLVNNLHYELLKVDPEYTVFQIKEKFGRLCFYFSNVTTDPKFVGISNKLVTRAELKSVKTCEECGSTEDNVHIKSTSSGWRKALCDCCADKERIE